MSKKSVEFGGVTMSMEAARLAEWCGVDVKDDVRRLRRGDVYPGKLLEECLDGVDKFDDAQGDLTSAWHDYVNAVEAAAREVTYRVELSNGQRIDVDTLLEAELWCRDQWPECVIGHDGDLRSGGGDRALVWKNEADSVDDAGAYAVASIVEVRS
jgi:hypothetical protein